MIKTNYKRGMEIQLIVAFSVRGLLFYNALSSEIMLSTNLSLKRLL